MNKLILKILFFIFLFTGAVNLYAADTRNGSQIYVQNCLICHGDQGEGVTSNTPDFRYGDNLIKPDIALFKTIGSGIGMMPAYRGVLSEQDIMDVISYLRTLQQ